MNKIVAGIVAEYNPFHNGHFYQLQQVRDFGADYVVSVMSGNFVQRGEPAIFPKALRANAALSCGVDVILELPLPYALSGAERFAAGAVESLLAFGVNLLSFGCEASDLAVLREGAEILSMEAWMPLAKSFLREGLSFPAARAKAVGQLYGADFEALISTPNNILAMAYLQALTSHHGVNGRGESVQIFPVLRKGAAHDTVAPHELHKGFASASQVRALLREENRENIASLVPWQAFSLYKNAPVCHLESLAFCALAMLRQRSLQDFSNLPDCSEGLEHRLYHGISHAESLHHLFHTVKSKRYTLARVRRLVWNAVLSVPAQLQTLPPPYLRLLALSNEGRRLLGECSPTLPISHSLLQLQQKSALCRTFAQLENASSDFYGNGFLPPTPCGDDLRLRLHRTL